MVYWYDLVTTSTHIPLRYCHAIVIPESIAPKILDGMLDILSCVHLGSARTEERILERFYWPNLRALP